MLWLAFLPSMKRTFYINIAKTILFISSSFDYSSTGCHFLVRKSLTNRVSTGTPGYGLRTEMIRNFFPISIMELKGSGNTEFQINFGTLFCNSGTFRKLFQKIPVCEKIVPGKGSEKIMKYKLWLPCLKIISSTEHDAIYCLH